MMSLTKKVEFALIILGHLEGKSNSDNQSSSSVIKAQEISTTYRISEDFVAKVMQKLCRNQILLSKQGAKGGYFLNITLSQVSLLQLLEALDGQYTIVNCINEDKTCSYDDGCSIIDPMRQLNSKVRDFYNNISLSEILSPYKIDKGNHTQNGSLKNSSKLTTVKSSSHLQNKNSYVSILYSGLSTIKNFITRSYTPINLMNLLKKLFQLKFLQPHHRIKVCLYLSLIIGLGIWGHAKEVNIYSYRQKFLIEGILDKFTASTGIKANIIYIKAGLAKRIKLEGKRSPADVILTTDIGQLVELQDNDIVQPLNNKTINSAIPSHLQHSQNLWFALTTRARIVYASKDRVKDDIQNYADLAHPRWKQKICIRSGYHPYNLALFSSLMVHEGKSATETFLKKLKGNLARKPQGNDRAQIKAIKEGLCDLSIGNSYYYAKMLFNYDNPEQIEWAKAVKLIFPNQANRGTHYNVSGMALARYSPNKTEAVKLMEFLVSDLAQYIYSSENYEFPVKVGTPLPSFLKTYMADVKWDNLSLEKMAKERRNVTLLLDKIQFDL